VWLLAKIFVIALLESVAMTARPAFAETDADIAPYAGMRLFADDGTYLGRLDCYSMGDPRSLHGNKDSSASIWDPRSPYGRKYSPLSPWNDTGEKLRPPHFVDDYGDTAVYVSKALGLTRVSTGAPLNTITPLAVEYYLMDRCHHFGGYRAFLDER
jgi:hypothetical protein